MKKKPIKDLAASVHQRLLDKARQAGRPFNELLQYFAIERFLYRLSQSKYAKNLLLTELRHGGCIFDYFCALQAAKFLCS